MKSRSTSVSTGLVLTAVVAFLSTGHDASARQRRFDPVVQDPYRGEVYELDERDPSYGDGLARATVPERRYVEMPGYPEGTVVISTSRRTLRVSTGGGEGIEYPVGVGRQGFSWTGTKTVTAKREWPSWTPPAEMLRRRPDLPARMEGGIDNPLGARALYLGSSLYRIHGSNEPDTIGQAVSSGCIRMTNEDVEDLYSRVPLGAKVIVK